MRKSQVNSQTMVAYATASALGPSLAGPMSERVVKPDAPRPRPATYEAGAVIVRNASLLAFAGAMAESRSERWEASSRHAGVDVVVQVVQIEISASGDLKAHHKPTSSHALNINHHGHSPPYATPL